MHAFGGELRTTQLETWRPLAPDAAPPTRFRGHRNLAWSIPSRLTFRNRIKHDFAKPYHSSKFEDGRDPPRLPFRGSQHPTLRAKPPARALLK